MPDHLIRAGRKAAVALGIATGVVCLLIATSLAVNAADKGGPKSIFEDVPAAKAFSWTGMYIGGNVGYTVSDSKLSDGGDSIDGLSGRGPTGGLHAGFDYQVPGSILVIGARGGYSWGSVEFKINDSGMKALGVSIEDGWYIDGRLGVVMGSALPYIFGGYTEVKTAASYYGTGVPGMPTLEGYRLGAGVEWRLNTKVMTLSPTLALEYAYTNYKAVLVDDVTVDPTSHAFGARLNLRFGTQ